MKDWLSDWLERSQELDRRILAAKRVSSATVTFTGEEHEQLSYAMLLNRRMFDRGLEHEVLDAAFMVVISKLAEAFWKAHPELRDEQRVLVRDMEEHGKAAKQILDQEAGQQG